MGVYEAFMIMESGSKSCYSLTEVPCVHQGWKTYFYHQYLLALFVFAFLRYIGAGVRERLVDLVPPDVVYLLSCGIQSLHL